ncbi:MAG: hypothetical protein IJS60_06705 [Abditibacteriota bacterium]|nr:hypothetical protein [Abditibacteriota bacterium]
MIKFYAKDYNEMKKCLISLKSGLCWNKDECKNKNCLVCQNWKDDRYYDNGYFIDDYMLERLNKLIDIVVNNGKEKE